MDARVAMKFPRFPREAAGRWKGSNPELRCAQHRLIPGPKPKPLLSRSEGADCCAIELFNRVPTNQPTNQCLWSGFGGRILKAEDLFLGMVAGADQGAGLDVAEAHRFADAFVVGELLGRDPAVDGQVPAGGLKVLADGEDVAGLVDAGIGGA